MINVSFKSSFIVQAPGPSEKSELRNTTGGYSGKLFLKFGQPRFETNDLRTTPGGPAPTRAAKYSSKLPIRLRRE